MRCALCGQTIRWTEQQGWVTVGADDMVIWNTSDCSHRTPPSDGHRL